MAASFPDIAPITNPPEYTANDSPVRHPYFYKAFVFRKHLRKSKSSVQRINQRCLHQQAGADRVYEKRKAIKKYMELMCVTK